MSHKEIVAYLNSEHSVPPWWQQMVTVGYEQYRGLRQKHETPAGFQASASKTIAVPVAALYQAWADDKLRARWLRRALTVRRATPDKSLRISWARGQSEVDVNLYAKGAGKSQVALEHRKLASADEVTKMKAFWKKALETLKDQLETQSTTG